MAISRHAGDRVVLVDLWPTLSQANARQEIALRRLVAAVSRAVARLKAWLQVADPAPKAGAPATELILLPLIDARVEELRQLRLRGYQLCLISDVELPYLRAVAAHIPMFDDVVSIPDARRLSTDAKLQLAARDLALDPRQVEYYGSSATPATGGEDVRKPMPWRAVSFLAVLVDAIRLRQWSKNVLVFVPPLLSPTTNVDQWVAALLAFFAFSFTASVAYIFNDVLDLDADRAHPVKRNRPFARAALPVIAAPLIALPLALGALLLALALPASFQTLLIGYFVATCLYSFYVKRMLIVDVVLLACLYATRVGAGALATGITLSQWLLGFCVFFFLSLALVKREAELHTMTRLGRERAGNRSYITRDLPIIAALAIASAFNAFTIFALFISSPDINLSYSQPEILWLAVPVLVYWACRVIVLTNRGKMTEDPIVFAAGDLKSWLCGVATISILLAAR